MKARMTCPYCGTSQMKDLNYNMALFGSRVEICDQEEMPGCGRAFVLEWEIKAETKTFRIEGK